jgi:hypothetical protein
MLGKSSKRLGLFLLLTFNFQLSTVLTAQQPTSTAALFEVNSHYLGGRTWADYKGSAGAGLTLNIAAGTAYCGNPPVPVFYAGGTLTLTASQTNYVYLDPAATCVPAFNITGFAVGQIPLAKVVTGASTITTVTDVRSWFVPLPCVMSATGALQCSALGTDQSIILTPSGAGRLILNPLVRSQIDFSNGATLRGGIGIDDGGTIIVGANAADYALRAESGVFRFARGGGYQTAILNGSGWATSVNVVTFTATPTFDASLGNTQKITLTDNVTSSTLSNATAGETINFIICQDATGSRTFVWPTNVLGGMTIGATLSKCSAQNFIFDGTNAYALSAGVTNM